MADFWGAIHMWMPENIKEWYSRNSYPYTLRSTLEPPPWLPGCSSTGDPEALNIVVWWLRRCLGEHAQCSCASSQADPSHHPARLVYVGSSSDDNETRLFINDQENVPTPEYLTLSYCCGKKEFPCLTKETLSTFIERIDVNALPATLREAIQVTRRLGHSYIWIDALCILQDSKEDWQTESIKMGSIYRASVLTIAAMGAPSVFHGLFMSRNPLCYQDLHLSNSKFVFSARAGHVAPRFKREFEVLGPAASPLQTRAWCVQEELLAPRTLFFGASGLF